MAEMRGGATIKRGLSNSPIDYFKMFYNDCAISGSTSALMCAYNFYGAKQMLFGTDMPFDMELGNEAIRETIRSVDQINITDSEKQAIFEGNAKRLLHFA
jgi:aminocarboxymuconate-semialdehyde decarboxylase